MTGRLVDGILCDYTVPEMTRLAMDRAPPELRRRKAQRSSVVLTIDTDQALRDHEREQLAKLIPHLHRL